MLFKKKKRKKNSKKRNEKRKITTSSALFLSIFIFHRVEYSMTHVIDFHGLFACRLPFISFVKWIFSWSDKTTVQQTQRRRRRRKKNYYLRDGEKVICTYTMCMHTHQFQFTLPFRLFARGLSSFARNQSFRSSLSLALSFSSIYYVKFHNDIIVVGTYT